MEYPLAEQANRLASRGRWGDSVLVHMNPAEVAGIASLVPGGKLTTNPDTGLPEAFLPMLLGLGGSLIGGSVLGPALAGTLGAGLGTAVGSGIGGMAGNLIGGANPRDALLSGIMSGVGAGLFSGMGGAGDAAKNAALQSAASKVPGTSAQAIANQPAAYAQMTGNAGTQAAPGLMAQAGNFLKGNAVPLGMGALGLAALADNGGRRGGVAPNYSNSIGQLRSKAPDRRYQLSNPTEGRGGFDRPTRYFPARPYRAGGPVQAVDPTTLNAMARVGAAPPQHPTAPSPGVMAMSGRAQGIPQPSGHPMGNPGALAISGRAQDMVRAPQGQEGLTKAAAAIDSGPRSGWWGRHDARMGGGQGFDQRRNTNVDGWWNRHNARKGDFGEGFGKGFAEGGPVAGLGQIAAQAEDAELKRVYRDAVMALRGQSADPDSALTEFVHTFGPEALVMLREAVNAGHVKGPGGGQDDAIAAMIDGQEPAALSDGEFVVPSDVVSHLGDGSNDEGANRLSDMMDRVRVAKTGSPGMPPRATPNMLPA